ncbi:N-6 DNA methylase [Vibrio splendidus]|uniref:class I SAM-dependent DNA methyltransferase n=1 Tax=Vibrio splendidus TaxID=29497 RepID=UPI0024683187|nr:N-6 DNA methylase [Vibrio splendidus]MDH5896510.1 type I restriction-modification system subunit M [Vibrio splendidus]
MLQNNKQLKSLIVNLWNTFWSGGLSNPITAIEQISYLLFMRRLDELDRERSADPSYTSIFSGSYMPYRDESKGSVDTESDNVKPRSKEELRWSAFKEMPNAKDMLKHVKFNVFPFIKNMRDDGESFSKAMENAIFSIERASLLSDAIEKIEDIYIEINIDAKESGYAFQDIQGDVYEMLLGELSQAGKNGQFRTPRHIINLMVELIEPKSEHRIADPACGTSGFLLGAYQYILTDIVKTEAPSLVVKDADGFERGGNSKFLAQEQKEKLDKKLHGFDIDHTMVRLGLMNLIMHGIDNPSIENQDTLSSSYKNNKKYDVVLANPPFTGKINIENLSNDLGVDTRSTELLFLSRISKMLKVGGKAAVIIPEGVLFGNTKAHKLVREFILKDNHLDAVISLPSGVFKPYTGVKTSILIFKKPNKNESKNKWATNKVWFYELNNDGYSLDDNRRKLKDNPLPKVKSLYEERNNSIKEDRKNNFFIEIEEIKDNGLDLSFNRYREYEYIEKSYRSPKDILSELLRLEDEISSNMNELNGLIG